MIKEVVIDKYSPFTPELGFPYYFELIDIIIVKANHPVDLSLSYFESGVMDEEASYKFTLNGKNVSGKPVYISQLQEYIDKRIDRDIFSLKIDDGDSDSVIKIVYTTKDNFISLENPTNRFEEHIKSPINDKIFFSASFGQGKTTFLEYFFNKKDEEYNLFKVFPVNYSVSSNKDIFKYIKCDLLFQLLGKDLEWGYEHISKVRATEEFIFLNPMEVIKNILSASAHLNKDLGTVLNKLKPLGDAIEKYHEEQCVDHREDTLKYLKKIYNQEGSLYEDNLYSQIIRNMLDQLKGKTNQKNILLIDDLDRIDPEHIFRILNVVSAHYDSYNNDSVSTPNKFGFDKIILVCDLENIRSIFKHKFGSKTDFEGYVDKYYSSAPFEFNNQDTVALSKEIIDRFYENEGKHRSARKISDFYEVFLKILLDLVMLGKLSLRKFISITHIDWSMKIGHIFSSDRNTNKINHSLFLVVIECLNYSFDLENVFEKLRLCEIDSDNFQEINFERYINMGLVGISKGSNKSLFYVWGDKKITTSSFQLNSPFFEVQKIDIQQGYRIQYSNKSFYELLRLNYEFYKENSLRLA